MKRMIVNADDFGLATNVTEGILDASRDGIVSSTSLMVGAPDAERAAQLALQEPELAVGIHLTLVDGKPVEPAGRVASLLGRNGRFFDDYRHFIRQYVAGRIRQSEVRAECVAQIKRFLDLGLVPTHLDSHQHIHLLPGIFEVVQDLCEKYGIRRLRIPVGGWLDKWRIGVGGIAMEVLSRRGRRLIRRHSRGLAYCDCFLGPQYSCRLDKQRLLDLIDQVGEGTSELMCHPGRYSEQLLREHPWGRNWQLELAALKDHDVRDRVRQRGITIVGHV